MRYSLIYPVPPEKKKVKEFQILCCKEASQEKSIHGLICKTETDSQT